MRTQSRDTRPEAEKVLIELLRKASVAKRFNKARSLTVFITKLNHNSLRRLHPNASQAEIAGHFVKGHFNPIAATGIQSTLAQRTEPFIADLLITLIPAIEVFERLAIPYYIKGTIAASSYGIPQTAGNIDCVADLTPEHLHFLMEALKETYYFDMEATERTIGQTAFEGIHLETLLKIIVSLPTPRAFDKEIWLRTQQHQLIEGDPREFSIASPEDIVLTMLEQYHATGERDDALENEILGVLKVQGPTLDLAYLEHWATILNLANLLDQACIDAGLKD